MSATTVPGAVAPKRYNPYVGPRPFSRDQHLPNRDVEAQDVADLLVSERVLLLQSASGAGKTSLIQAGVLRRLSGFLVAGPVRVDKPVPRGTDGLAIPVHNRYVFSIAMYLMGDSESPETLGRMRLRDVVLAATSRMEGEGLPLLIIDQFEEILTLDPTDHAEKEAFFEELGAAVDGLGEDDDSGIWLLLAMRDDALGALDPFLQHIPGYLRSRYRLSLLTREEAKAAIQRPAADQGVTISDDAAEELMDRLAHTRVRTPGLSAAESLRTTVIEPLQLQVLCRRLWKDLLKKGHFDRIDLAHVTRLPADYVERALSRYYSDSVAEVAEVFGIEEKAVRDWFETSLITEQGDRSQTTRGPVEGEDEAAILARLRDMFLINSDRRGATTWYELAHDRLVGAVKVANRAWRYQHLAAWQLQALDWKQSNRNPSLLLPPGQLPYARSKELSPLEAEFREACLRDHGGRFRVVRWQLLSGFVLGLAIVELVIIIVLLARS